MLVPEAITLLVSTKGRNTTPSDLTAESFFSTLKLHLLYERKQFQSKLEARIGVGEWIEAYYNRRRIHTSTGKIPKKAMDDFLTPPVTTAAQAA